MSPTVDLPIWNNCAISSLLAFELAPLYSHNSFFLRAVRVVNFLPFLLPPLPVRLLEDPTVLIFSDSIMFMLQTFVNDVNKDRYQLLLFIYDSNDMFIALIV